MKNYVKIHKKRQAISPKQRLLTYISVLLIIILFLTAGRFLTLSQPPQQAAVIIVLSGGSGRVEKAAELYKAGYAPYMILSNAKESTSTVGDMLQTALALGIPQEAILTEDSALSTYQNAEYTLPIMKEQGFTSAIIVSSDFHMRRVKFIFDHVYKKSGIELTYVGSNSDYNAKRWWSDKYSRETTFNEYTKMVGNAFGYNGPEAKNALDQIKSWFH
ncbi:YdcF family protein [Paenibacillus sp. 19GGS1-52]|uniref:YdcF family protein n=1 Tax=Paenibacillus sp. 19GGS1-52 TaxID=2758563 RepID=UPI001EFBF82D|nr:YdcF family protein [Paenibacillus sp. 19GGS1-52]ULO08646.1 YdcF family protein [Paenibacillus sp. 19GGS1-52]